MRSAGNAPHHRQATHHGLHQVIARGSNGKGTGVAIILSPAARSAVDEAGGTVMQFGDRIMAISQVGTRRLHMLAPHAQG